MCLVLIFRYTLLMEISQKPSVGTAPVDQEFDLSVALFADSHFRADPLERSLMPGPSYLLRERAELILEQAATQLHDADLVVHNGDVVDRGDVKSYAGYDELLVSSLPDIPAYFTAGNHDQGEIMQEHLRMGERENIFQSAYKQCYTVTQNNHTLVFVDGSIPNDYVYAELGPEVREWLADVLHKTPATGRIWLFSHFPLFKQSEQLPDRSALLDGKQVHDLLVPHKDKMGAVFSAHIHRLYPKIELDGISYVSLCSSSTPIRHGEHGKPAFDPDGVVGFHHLRLASSGAFDLSTQRVFEGNRLAIGKYYTD
jgi:3',5'-cyclic AMP phosphodiesterase CpdA